MKRIESDQPQKPALAELGVPLVRATPTQAVWSAALEARELGARPDMTAWSEMERAAFALYDGLVGEGAPFVFAQIGQSLDGRVATVDGDALGVSGRDGLMHLHRCRALADAVVVGVGTALSDDPQLTVRLVEGESPARVVVDPAGRVPDDAALLRDDGCRRLVVQACGRKRPKGVEAVELPRDARGHIDPALILSALAERGFGRVLIEGGGITIGRFLDAGLVDRLHVSIAPLIIGAGAPALTLQPVARLGDALRPLTRAYGLGTDIIFDCEFVAVGGKARRSTWPTRQARSEVAASRR
jgi:riboflavin-specific deaminase-like protein